MRVVALASQQREEDASDKDPVCYEALPAFWITAILFTGLVAGWWEGSLASGVTAAVLSLLQVVVTWVGFIRTIVKGFALRFWWLLLPALPITLPCGFYVGTVVWLCFNPLTPP